MPSDPSLAVEDGLVHQLADVPQPGEPPVLEEIAAEAAVGASRAATRDVNLGLLAIELRLGRRSGNRSGAEGPPGGW
jgi:hypothetical protein